MITARFKPLVERFCALAVVTLGLLATPFLHAAPFAERFSFTQPGGTTIELWGQGDEFSAVFETLDGYTVVFDATLRAYCYAGLSADGSRLLPTSLVVGAGDPRSLSLAPHLRMSAAARRLQIAERFARWDAGLQVSQRWTDLKLEARASGRTKSPPSRTTTGTKVGLTLLIDFDDAPATIPQAEIVDFCNGDNYTGFGNNGSVKQYFADVSNGSLIYSNVVTLYVRIPNSAHPRSWYNDTTKDEGDQANYLIEDAITIMKALPNYTTDILPAFDALTVDGQNRVIACNVFFAGSNSGVWSKGLWPHAWALYNAGAQELSPGGKKVWRYQISNIGSRLGIGTFCHENGHLLCGFPDLYDYDYDSKGGAGNFCIMGYGSNGNNPAQVCAYLKRAAGWATTTDLSSNSSLIATLSALPGVNFNRFYRYPKPGTSTEYFLVECRYQGWRDATLPTSGIAVWHIDELGDRDNQSLTPNSAHANYEATLVQADNRWDFEKDANAGDPNDLYYVGNSASGYASALRDSTAPNAHWWNGANSGMVLRSFSTKGSNMTFIVGAGSVQPMILAQPASQTVYAGATVSFTVSAVGAPTLTYQWRRNGASIAGATAPSFTITNVQTDQYGSYSVVVANSQGSVSSANATLVVVPLVALPVALNNNTLVWTTEGDASWFGQTNVSHDGAASAQSGTLSDGQQSRLKTIVSGPGTLAFWWKVSSQSGADQLTFRYGGNTQNSISGEGDWQQSTVHLPAGSQTLEWVYAKDSAASSGADKGWVDQVSYTAEGTAPGIASQPGSQSLIAGAPAALSVVAYGTPPLAYQWQFNGTNLPNATNAVLTIAKAGTANNGSYSIAVSNDYGLVLSSNAVLSVICVAAFGNNDSGQSMVPPAATNVVAVAAGSWHSLALRGDGTVIAWGNNFSGQCDVPESLTDAVAIAGGGYHSLAVRADGTVTAWGADYVGQTDVPSGLNQVLAVAAGAWHSLALRGDGTVVAWGDNNWGQCNVPADLTNAVAIAAAGNHSLAIRSDGRVVAWGDNTDAQSLFVGQSSVPFSLPRAVGIGAGAYHSLAAATDGRLTIWGDNSSGQAASQPDLTDIVAVAGGDLHSLALRENGSLFAWGNNNAGQCNPPSNLTNVVAIAAGNYHNVVLLGEPGASRPILQCPAQEGSRIRLPVATQRNRLYVLEYKDSLAAAGWTWHSALAGDGTTRVFTDSITGTLQRFYRVRAQ